MLQISPERSQYNYYDKEDQNYTPVDVVDGKVPYGYASKIINPKISPSTTDIPAVTDTDDFLKIPKGSKYSIKGGKVLFDGKEVNNASVVLPTTKTDGFSKYLAFSAPKGQYLTSLQDINSDAYIVVKRTTSNTEEFMKISDYTELSPQPKLMEWQYDTTTKKFSWKEKGTQTIEAKDVYANNNTNLKYFDTNLNPKLKLPTGGGTLPRYVVPTGTKTIADINPDAYIVVKKTTSNTEEFMKISDYTKLSPKPKLMESQYDTTATTYSWKEKSTQTIADKDVYATGNTKFSQSGISIDSSGKVSQIVPTLPANINKDDVLKAQYTPVATNVTTLPTGIYKLPSYVVPTGTETIAEKNPDAYIAVKDDNLSTPKLIKISDYTKLSSTSKPQLMESKYDATANTYSWKEKGTQTIEAKDVYAKGNTAFSQPGIIISDGNINLNSGILRDFYLDNTAIAVAWENGNDMKGFGTVSNPRLISLEEYYEKCKTNSKFMSVVKFDKGEPQVLKISQTSNGERELLDYIKNPGFDTVKDQAIFNGNSNSQLVKQASSGNLKTIDTTNMANGKITPPVRQLLNPNAIQADKAYQEANGILKPLQTLKGDYEKFYNNEIFIGLSIWLMVAGVLSLCFSINRMSKEEQDTSDLEGFLGVPHSNDGGLVGFGKVITSVLDTALGGIPAALATGIGGGLDRVR